MQWHNCTLSVHVRKHAQHTHMCVQIVFFERLSTHAQSEAWDKCSGGDRTGEMDSRVFQEMSLMQRRSHTCEAKHSRSTHITNSQQQTTKTTHPFPLVHTHTHTHPLQHQEKRPRSRGEMWTRGRDSQLSRYQRCWFLPPLSRWRCRHTGELQRVGTLPGRRRVPARKTTREQKHNILSCGSRVLEEQEKGKNGGGVGNIDTLK